MNDNSPQPTQQEEATVIRTITLRKMDELEELKIKRRNAKEMLDSELENDQAYSEALETVKKAKEILKQCKKRAMSRIETSQLDDKVKDFSAQCRSVRKDISVFLVQYNEITGEKKFAARDGVEIEIVKSAKARRKKKKEQYG